LRRALVGPPDGVTVLAVTAWDHGFALHGVQQLPTPKARELFTDLRLGDAVTDLGTRHEGGGGGGHGHPRFLWHAPFTPALPAEARSLTVSGIADGTAFTTVIGLPGWPPATHAALTQAVTTNGAAPGSDRPDEAGTPLPDRVVALSTDLGIVGDVRRVLTTLYCWPGWFLLAIEASGAVVPQQPPDLVPAVWEMHDDQGNRYRGRWRGGWGGADTGAHVAFAPGLDPHARELRLSFPDPFTPSAHLTTLLPLPS
jgi:hypothetical protein